MRSLTACLAGCLVSTFVSTLAASPALADRVSYEEAKPGPWQQGAKARALIKPWSTCELQAEVLAPADDGEVVRVRKVGRAVDVERYFAGSGRWAAAMTKMTRLDGGTCMGAGFTAVGGKESIWSVMVLSRAGAVATHTRAAAMSEALLVTDQAGAELAAARMAVELTRESDGTAKTAAPGELLLPAAQRVQAEHGGEPRGSQATLWSPHALKLADVPLAALAGDGGSDDGPVDGVLIAAVRAPKVLATKGRWQLWELRFRSRLGGGLLAVYDRERKQHRWVFGSEHDGGKDGHFELISVREELALVRTHLDDNEELWAIDLTSGEARQLAKSGPYRVIGDQLELADDDGGRQRVPLSTLRP